MEGNHKITMLIIDAVHRKFHHQARETVTNELRCKFWIPKIRVFINKTIARCNQCALRKARPEIPRMANLPKERIMPFTPAFSYTGLDYMGPFDVTVGRRREKRYIAIFTCLTMRAIHLEVACTLDTSSCVMCVRNFMNRRGIPIEIMSDNGTNLRASEKELKQLLENVNTDKLAAQTQPLDALNKHIIWRFIPPSSPHFGGAWERMVRTVKNSLYHVMKEKAPRDETFRSAVIEVEATVNSRPLNYSSSKDISEPAISPNTLLHLSGGNTFIPRNPHPFDSKKQWAICQEISYAFWKRWLREYLPTIAIRTKWFDDNKPLNIGQLVLIMDNNLRRGEWQRGRVISVAPGSDGKIRAATVKTAKGTYLRPVTKLAIIRCSENES
jgi:hypothetical protein